MGELKEWGKALTNLVKSGGISTGDPNPKKKSWWCCHCGYSNSGGSSSCYDCGQERCEECREFEH